MSPDSSKEELQAEADETEVVSSETETPADSPIEDEKDELSQLISERDSYLDDLQRVTAEFSNFRKQSAKRSAEVGARSQAELIEKLYLYLTPVTWLSNMVPMMWRLFVKPLSRLLNLLAYKSLTL